MTSTSNCMSFLKPLYVRMWKVRASNGKLMSMSFPAGRFRFMKSSLCFQPVIVTVPVGLQEVKFDVWPLRAAGQRAEGDPQAEGAALRGGSTGGLAVLTAIFGARRARSRCPR